MTKFANIMTHKHCGHHDDDKSTVYLKIVTFIYKYIKLTILRFDIFEENM